jgi:hypothetical protein
MSSSFNDYVMEQPTGKITVVNVPVYDGGELNGVG